MTTFNPPVSPNVGTTGTTNFRVLEAKFGDGYDQSAGDGINAEESEYSLVWTDLSVSDFETIRDFFVALGGYQTFDYTLPNHSTSYKWKAKSFSETYQKGNKKGLTVNIKRTFVI